MRLPKVKLFKVVLSFVIAFVVLSVCAFIFLFRPYSSGFPPRIPNGWGFGKVSPFKGRPALPKPIHHDLPPSHPYLASTNSANMHVDSYASDVHPLGGPIGMNPYVMSYSHRPIAGECACVTFDSKGNIVAMFGSLDEFTLQLMAPDDLRPLASLTLPPRASNKTLNLRRIMTDTSGGAYFYLDSYDRAVLVDAKQTLKVVGQDWSHSQPRLTVIWEYPLLPFLEAHTSTSDVVTAVLPDWEGRYWFVSRDGSIGLIDPEDLSVTGLVLPDESIQNSFAVDEAGVYVVSDQALYGVYFDSQSKRIRVAWREEYTRARALKPGSITLGSGSTPTLLGENLVVITDNAEPQIHVVAFHREMKKIKDRLICSVPVFAPGKSATENTLIGIGNSVIVENNYGYDLFLNMMFGRVAEGGVARVDIDTVSGTGIVKWLNPVVSQTTVPKLSAQNGLVYTYTKDTSAPWLVDAYYLTAIDFETGDTIFQVLVGTGVGYDNNWAPITLGPDASAYVGVLRGLVKIKDGGTEYDY